MRPAEWRVSCFIIALMISLGVIAKIKIYKSESVANKQTLPKKILIQITGAVARPGGYEITAGTSIRKALDKAHPDLDANLRNLDLDAPLSVPITLEIQKLRSLKVQIYFEEQFLQELEVKPKDRICDLKSKLNLSSAVDPAPFKSRRRVKDGEIIRLYRSNPQSACRK